jgi:hypothetical protein
MLLIDSRMLSSIFHLCKLVLSRHVLYGFDDSFLVSISSSDDVHDDNIFANRDTHDKLIRPAFIR